LADVQRKLELKKELAAEPAPLFREVREVVLRKCASDKEAYVRAIFEKDPFGELERLVTHTLLDVVKGVATQELENDYWLRMVAELSHQSYEETRVIVLEFLDTDIFHLSRENCVAFLDPLIESWDIDLATFALDIVLNPRVVSGHVRRFEFIERESGEVFVEEPGLREFLEDPALSGTASEEEVRFLKRLRFKGKRADAPLLLSGVTEPQRPAPFSPGVRVGCYLLPRPTSPSSWISCRTTLALRYS
jgi:hypothetical protein